MKLFSRTITFDEKELQAELDRIQEQLDAREKVAEDLWRTEQRLLEVAERREVLDDALRDILDVTENFTRFRHADAKLAAITGIAETALKKANDPS